MTADRSTTTIPTIVSDWIAHFEKEEGHKPTDTTIQIVSLAYEMGCQMADRGYSDKQIGREPIPFSTFEAAARSIIAGTTVAAIQCANIVAELIHEQYMIGYNGEKQ